MIRLKKDFSFGDHASDFETHISSSIPGYKDVLIPDCVRHSLRFVQSGTNVYDVGCSTGNLLERMRRANQASRPDVQYIGIDCEAKFAAQWERYRRRNITLGVFDALTYRFENASLISSLFTVQFIRSRDKFSLLSRIYDGLVAGGALIIAEKTLAETARLQDAMTFPYYDFKRQKGHSAEQILDKERSLRGQMTLWTETELRTVLSQVGFSEINPFWRSSLFVAYLALKGPRTAVDTEQIRAGNFFQVPARKTAGNYIYTDAISASMMPRNPPDCGVSADYPVS